MQENVENFCGVDYAAGWDMANLFTENLALIRQIASPLVRFDSCKLHACASGNSALSNCCSGRAPRSHSSEGWASCRVVGAGKFSGTQPG